MSRLATHLTVNNIIQSLWFGWIVPTVRLDAPLSGRVVPGETLPCSSVGVEIQSYWSEKRKRWRRGKNLGQPLLDKPLQSNSFETAINRLLQAPAQNLTLSSFHPSICPSFSLLLLRHRNKKPPDFFVLVGTKMHLVIFKGAPISQLTQWHSS